MSLITNLASTSRLLQSLLTLKGLRGVRNQVIRKELSDFLNLGLPTKFTLGLCCIYIINLYC